MGSDELKKRRLWQDKSGKKANESENIFYHIFDKHFIDTEFKIIKRPKEFKDIYVNFPLKKEVEMEIYHPDTPIKNHGIVPDFSIKNINRNKTLYVEIKRQDGWVENKLRKDGRGNAHERLCKYFTPGLLKIIRKNSNINENYLPFWTVFVGDITRDPCRVREITCWFDIYSENFFFWRNIKNSEVILKHFDEKLKHHLL